MKSVVLAMREFKVPYTLLAGHEIQAAFGPTVVTAITIEKDSKIRHVVILGLFEGKARVGFSVIFGNAGAKYAKQAKKLGVYKKTRNYFGD